MDKWEYRTIYFDPGGRMNTTIFDSLKGVVQSSGASDFGKYAKLVSDYLDATGEEGWEAVGTSHWMNVHAKIGSTEPTTDWRLTVLLKRRK